MLQLPTVTLLVLSAAALLPGCATGATYRAMPAGYADVSQEGGLEIWGDQQRLQFSKQVQVQLPAKLAVAEVSNASWLERAQVSERRRVDLVRSLTEDDETFSDVVSLRGPGHERNRNEYVESLRALAAQHQADLMLLVERAEISDSDTTWLGFTKLLILPIWLMPTEEHQLQVSLRMAVMDVRNGLIYTTVDEAAAAVVTSTSAGSDEAVEEGLERLFGDALATMRAELAQKLRTYDTDVDG